MARKRRAEPSSTQEQEEVPHVPAKRTANDINLAVLSRYVPGLQQIEDIAPFTVLYIFSAETRQWEKCNIEGSLFVCRTWRDGYEGFSVVILNRKSLNNFIVDITGTNQVELTEQYVILQGVEEDGAPQIYGVWIFSEEGVVPSTKDRLGELMQRCAVAVEQNELAEDEEEEYEQDHTEQQTGQQLDLNTLFTRPQVQQETHILQQPVQPMHNQQLDLLRLFGSSQVQPEQHITQPQYQQTQHQYHMSPSPHQQQPQSFSGGSQLGPKQNQLLNLFKSGPG